jgi:hypothetical protein
MDWAFDMARILRMGLILVYVRYSVRRDEWIRDRRRLRSGVLVQASIGLPYVLTGRFGLAALFGPADLVGEALPRRIGRRRAAPRRRHPRTSEHLRALSAAGGTDLPRSRARPCGGVYASHAPPLESPRWRASARTLSPTSWAIVSPSFCSSPSGFRARAPCA